MTVLIRVIQDLSLARSLAQVQAIVRRAARELTGADGATFILREGDQCFYADEDAIGPLWKGLRFPMSACVSGWSMQHRQALAIEDIYADPRIPQDAYRPTFVKSLAMTPIRMAEPIGAIGTYWATQYRPTERQLAELQALADSTSIALENVELIAQLEARIAERTAALAERERAEAALRRTEHQLRHAQKMEAVGRLAGGIAHDFNNLLSVILSYASVGASELPPGHVVRQDLEEIYQAGERAAALVRQILAFSRQQVIEPRVIQVNDVVSNIEKMLRRIVGADIDLEVRLDPDAPPTLADPGLVEQVLANLVVNARDAMPDGGRLTIETTRMTLDAGYVDVHFGVTPGEHVMLAVSDTGIGMDKELQARIFEPFFTTKEAGRGTGLGLSTVYGIVKQSGGHVWVYSEPGRGTTFKIYLPASQIRTLTRATARPAPASLQGSEVIALVEDDPQVRGAIRNILLKAGYRVREYADPVEAERALAAPGDAPVDLLLTDIVMPQSNGVELARRLRVARPEIRVLCMSGYTDEAALRHGLIDSGLAFLQKPITPERLLTKVREVLAASPGDGAP
ncbi:MAG: response regulator [Deltaproteobacteria bacterium]|nr:response regulator [Deltaproteobacteria bacterium]